MILVKVVTSSNSRGWEGNEESLQEYDGTLGDYVINYFDGEQEGREEFLSGDTYYSEGYGIVPGGSDEDGYDYEGEEVCYSFSVFTPSQNYVNMLQKYVK